MRFEERLEKAEILVIGATYEAEDYHGDVNSEGWASKDLYYIGLGQAHGQPLIEFENGNPLNVDWNEDNFLDIIKKTLKNKKFTQIWVDRITMHHFLRKDKNKQVLKYILENHASSGCKFYMEDYQSTSSNEKYSYLNGKTYAEISNLRETERIPKYTPFSFSNPNYHDVIELLQDTIKISNSQPVNFREFKFAEFNVIPRCTVFQEKSDAELAKVLQEEEYNSELRFFDMKDKEAINDGDKQAIKKAWEELNPGKPFTKW